LLINVITFLNLGLAGFVLAAIAARFLFPAVSLEGRTLWLLRSSPLRPARAALEQVLGRRAAAARAGARAHRRHEHDPARVSGFMMVLSMHHHRVMTFAISRMALGFGAMFPKFDTENAAEIPTSFGGLLFMMTAMTYLGVVIALQAWPVYAILQARESGVAGTWPAAWLAGSLGLALLISLVAIVLPLRVAAQRIEALD
jgi:ABC-2 type transport system permease protein